MLKQRRGYNAVVQPWGNSPFPNNLQPTQGATPLTWNAFGAQLQAHGVNMLRVKFTGRTPIDGGTLPDEFISMCLKYGIGIHAIPFENTEWGSDAGWHQHAWNARNGGPLEDRRNVLRDRGAIDAAKRRVDAVAKVPGICSWEVVAEFPYLFTQEFFNTDWAGLQRVVMEEGVPWTTEIVSHIHSVHSAPVGGGHVDRIGMAAEFKNEVHRVPGMDFAMVNWYGDQDVSAKMPELRKAQAYTKLPCYVEQYAPWNLGSGAGYERDGNPFPRSKAHEWAAVCGEYGVTGPMRWPEIRPKDDVSQWWGVAHPNMAEIAGVTAAFSAAVDLDDWTERGQAWDTRITGDNLSFIASWGNGRHVTAYCDWSTGGTQVVEVAGLTGQFSSVKTFDFLTGEQTGEQVVETINGTALFTVPTVGTRGVFYLAPFGAVPPPVYELHVSATLKMDGQNVRSFAGMLQEV